MDIGIDVAKDQLDWAEGVEGTVRSTSNDARGIRGLVRRLALAEDPERRETAELLQTVPSVGPGVARTLLIDLPELGRRSRRQVASLVRPRARQVACMSNMT